jgi:hypothetical protein
VSMIQIVREREWMASSYGALSHIMIHEVDARPDDGCNLEKRACPESKQSSHARLQGQNSYSHRHQPCRRAGREARWFCRWRGSEQPQNTSSSTTHRACLRLRQPLCVLHRGADLLQDKFIALQSSATSTEANNFIGP